MAHGGSRNQSGGQPGPHLGRSNARGVSVALPGASAYAVEVGPYAVLLASPTALQDVLHALEGALRAVRNNGCPTPSRVVDLCAVLSRFLVAYQETAVAAVGNAAMPQEPELTRWEQVELVTVEQAAKLLGLQPRQVRNLTRLGRLPARKVGACWQIELVAVVEAARERRLGAA